MNEPTPEAATAPPPDAPSSVAPTASTPPIDLWERIKEHKVLQWGLAYLGAALALAHGGDLLGHTFNWPEAINRLLLGLLIVGFPIALALAWYHGHRSLRTISTGEATIISILVIIGAGLLVLFVRPPTETAQGAAIAPARTTAVADSAPAHQTSAGSDSGPSIAVLPFVNMSSDHDQEYFSDGLSEELLNELAQVPNLRVIGRTSSFAFKGKNEDLRTIGEALGVNHILEGSVRKSADSLRIVAQLINPADGSHLWSGTYDRKLGDIFEIQEDIARTVASYLRLSIEATNLTEGGTHNLDAYDAYLHSAAAATPMDAVSHLERAVQLDPKFTQAWADLAGAYGGAILFAPQGGAQRAQRRLEAENQVLTMAPNSAAAKLLLANRQFNAGNLLEADRLLQSVRNMPAAMRSDFSVVYGNFLLCVGRARDSLKLLRASQEVDPISPLPTLMVLINYEILGEMKEAEVSYRRASIVLPDNEILLTIPVLRAMGVHDPKALRAALAATSTSTQQSGADRNSQLNSLMVSHLDNAPAALTQLRRLISDPNAPATPLSSLVEANWAAYFGDAQLSLSLLRRIPRNDLASRESVMFSLWRPVEKSIRPLPQFKDFVRELGLADYWRASGNWGEFCHPVGANDFECN